MDNGLDDPWRRENPDSSEFTRYDRSSGTRSRIGRVYTDKKIASNTNINQIMVSFTDHCNAIFTDRFHSKTKIRKDSWCSNHSLLCKPEFSSVSKTSFFIRNTKSNHSSASDWCENDKSSFKDDARNFSENIYFFKNIEFQYRKEDCKTYTKKKTSNHKLNRRLKTYKMNFIN